MAMGDNIIRLTDENAARAEEGARAASKAAATAGEIFRRRDPVRTLAMQPKIVEALSTISTPRSPSTSTTSVSSMDCCRRRQRGRRRNDIDGAGLPAAQSLPVEVANKLKQLSGITDAHVDAGRGPAVGQGPDVGRRETATRDVLTISSAELALRLRVGRILGATLRIRSGGLMNSDITGMIDQFVAGSSRVASWCGA